MVTFAPPLRVYGFVILFIILSVDKLQAQFVSNTEYLLSQQLEAIFADSNFFGAESGKISEATMLAVAAIRFYQSFISSQDKPSCIFTMSCSQFGIEAIKQEGPLKGTWLAADRLMRCNSVAHRYYQKDPKTLKAIDNISQLFFHTYKAKKCTESPYF